MPVGGDLGFSYLVLAAALVAPAVIAFVVRRKWRASVARTEEIKRLLVLASEETARAELEASTYVTSPALIRPPLPYRCAVCYSPTTTRCSRCKAVRYCSGKCQIIHWRQGHQAECRSITTTYPINDVGGGASQKVLKQEEEEIYGNSFETEERQYAESVKNLPEEPAFSKSNGSVDSFCGSDDSEVKCAANGKEKNSSSRETERSVGHQSANVFPDKLETNCVDMDQNGPPSSKHNTSVGSVDRLTSSGKLNKIKPNGRNHDIQYEATSTSGWSADGTNESSFSEPSTPPSGFWEGTIKSSRPKIDTLDVSAQSSSRGTGDGNIHNSPSSRSSSFNFDNRNSVPSADVQGSDTTTVISDGAHSTTSGIKKPIDRAVLSEYVSKGRSSPLLSSPEKSNHMDVHTSSDSLVSKSREPRYISSSAYAYPTSSAGGPSVSTHASKVSSMRSVSPKRSNHVSNGSSTIPRSLESKESGPLLSTTRRHSLQGAKSGKDDSAHAVAVSSSESTSYSPNAINGLKTSMLKVVGQLRASKSSRHSQSEVGSEIAGRYDNKGLFSYELFVKLYNWNNIELRPGGLINCGNSCYANAVLQCLACTPPLTAYLLQGLHSKTCETKGWCFTCEFANLQLSILPENRRTRRKSSFINRSSKKMESPMCYESDHLNLKATELRLGLPGTDEPQKQSSQIVRTNKRGSSEIDDTENGEQDRAPPSKAQVVGWPPVRSYRKNCFQAKKTEADVCGMYVKVSMDGAPYLRKIDLKVYQTYPELLKALEFMFKCTIGYNGSEYAPTYEDKDGDWMLVGDVPWEMFITSCKRMRIMRASEAKGLGCL